MTLEELICAAVEEVASRLGLVVQRWSMAALGGESLTTRYHFLRHPEGPRLGHIETVLWTPCFLPQRMKEIPFSDKSIGDPEFLDDLEGYIKNLIGRI